MCISLSHRGFWIGDFGVILQCLMYLYHYPDIWYDYATWHSQNGSPDSAAVVFQRALKALPGRSGLCVHCITKPNLIVVLWLLNIRISSWQVIWFLAIQLFWNAIFTYYVTCLEFLGMCCMRMCMFLTRWSSQIDLRGSFWGMYQWAIGAVDSTYWTPISCMQIKQCCTMHMQNLKKLVVGLRFVLVLPMQCEEVFL